MENRKCPMLVNGKECGLALSLVEREVENATEIYECPLGHRAEVPFGEAETRSCAVLANERECGLPLSLIQRDLEAGTEIHECPLGHRTYLSIEPPVEDETC